MPKLRTTPARTRSEAIRSLVDMYCLQVAGSLLRPNLQEGCRIGLIACFEVAEKHGVPLELEQDLQGLKYRHASLARPLSPPEVLYIEDLLHAGISLGTRRFKRPSKRGIPPLGPPPPCLYLHHSDF